MNRAKFRILFLFLGLIWPMESTRAENLPDGYEYMLLAPLRPTQAVVGELEVRSRTIELEKIKKKPDKLLKLQLDKAPEIVFGPEKSIFVVEGHHFALASIRVGFEKVPMKRLANLSSLKWDEFRTELIKRKWVYLKEKGRSIGWEHLPFSLPNAKDDPHRALAWLARKCGSFKSIKIPFQEFEIADYLRDRVRFDASNRDSWKEAIKKSIDLLEKKDASFLPGWTGKNIGDCHEAKEIIKDVFNQNFL